MSAVKEQRDRELLEILWSQSDAGREWVAADTVASRYNHRHALGRDGLSALAVGRHLSRLAASGRCERQLGYMSLYRLAERPSWKRSTPLKRRTPLASVSPRRVEREKVRSTLKQGRGISPASKAQREKVRLVPCIRCGRDGVQPAHVIDRAGR
jgi:hypothetical protein